MGEGGHLLVFISLFSVSNRIRTRKCELDFCREDLDLVVGIVKQTA